MSALKSARRLLARDGGWMEAAGGGYVVRVGRDRRSRPMLAVGEAIFRALAEDPGLTTRPGGGWTLRSRPVVEDEDRAGRPGMVEGVVSVMEADGRVVRRRANAARSAVAWLAGRRDADGLPWLGPAEVAAAERLGAEAEIALRGPSLTMRWDALPRSGGGSAARMEPTDRALAAGRRVEAALAACGPARDMVDRICIQATALQAAENALGLRRREGKRLLKQGLGALAAHYRIG